MEKLGHKVLKKIKEEKISPKPVWHFLAKDVLKWIILSFSVVLGAFAVCILLHFILDHDPDTYKFLHMGSLAFFLMSFPYIWLLIFGILLFLVYQNFRYTRRGYCCENAKVIFGGAAASMLIGLLFFSLGLQKPFHNFFYAKVPGYERILCCQHRRIFWVQPERGLLGGKIQNVQSVNRFSLIDFGGNFWLVENQDGKDIVWKGNSYPKQQLEVKIIGEKRGVSIFWAREVRPWMDFEND